MSIIFKSEFYANKLMITNIYWNIAFSMGNILKWVKIKENIRNVKERSEVRPMITTTPERK